MNKPLIEGGYILLSRKIIESEIFDKPPLYLKVWVYLLSRAQHSTYKGLEKGQLYTSIPEIQEACSYMVGYRKVTPSKDQIFNVLEWLRKRYEGHYESNEGTTMITTTKATHGLLVNIDKYCFYQNPNNYESNKESNNEKVMKAERKQREANNTNKNVKNDKNDKNMNKEKEKPKAKSTRFVPPSLEEVRTYCKSRNNKVDAGQFIDFYESKGWMVGKNKMKDWKASVRTWEKRDSQPKTENKPTNKFNQFPQRTYTASDYADIERKLINKGL